MFGYVRPRVPALRVREYELYRGVYCGLCRAMGKVSGQLSRMTLSYDFCFLALIQLIFSEEEASFAPRFCPIHPLHRRTVALEHPALRYTAAAAAYLAESKRLDDRVDEQGSARLRPVLMAPVTGAMVCRSRKNEPDTAELFPEIQKHLAVLSAMEKENCGSPDETAQVFGELLGDLFAFGLSGADGAVARSVGVGTGRFIYLCDAMDDLAEDIRRRRYNPLALLWGDMALDESGHPSAMVREAFGTAVLLDLEKTGLAVELLPAGPLTEIVKNIVYLGMPETANRIANGDTAVPKRRLSLSDSALEIKA